MKKKKKRQKKSKTEKCLGINQLYVTTSHKRSRPAHFKRKNVLNSVCIKKNVYAIYLRFDIGD